jgi:predicted AAA+ superfamily ATPase
MKWYVELGYAANPFETDPLKIDSDILGYDDEVDDLLYHVESGNAVLIEGPKGSGKTMLLKEVIKEFGGKGRVVYINAEKLNKRLEIDDVLMRNQSFMRKIQGKKPKSMILLIDNAVAFPRKVYERLQYYFDQGYLLSIIFATQDHKKLQFPNSLFDRIGYRKIMTKPLTKEQAIEMAYERLNVDEEDDAILSKENLEKIYELSDDLISFLRNASSVAGYMVENDLDKCEIKTIQKALKEVIDNDAEEIETDICLECGEGLINVSGNFRCKNCDIYCTKCGVLVDEDDETCPNCSAKIEFKEDDEQ